MSDPSQSSQEQKLQELLKLKRHEQPPEGFHDAFLRDFQQRQRSELMRRSSFELFWDRFEALLGGGTQSRYALAGGVTALVIIAGVFANNLGQKDPSSLTQQPQHTPANGAPIAQPVSYPGDSKPFTGQARPQMQKVDLRDTSSKGTLNEF